MKKLLLGVGWGRELETENPLNLNLLSDTINYSYFSSLPDVGLHGDDGAKGRSACPTLGPPAAGRSGCCSCGAAAAPALPAASCSAGGDDGVGRRY